MEAQQTATTKLSDEEFLAFLEKHPDLRRRADHRGDAAFGAGGDAGVGGEASQPPVEK
jgi:hypothetical protein